MYKPNFCCECGERVLRARWRAWTSRRFCDACVPRFRRSSLATPLAVAASLACTGFVFGRLTRPTPPPLIVERGTLNLAPIPSSGAQRQSPSRQEGAETRNAPVYGPDGTANERPTEPDEVVYICGARTKKGTPCQRRVRGPFRCWQHKGMPAMLPQSKLIVPG